MTKSEIVYNYIEFAFRRNVFVRFRSNGDIIFMYYRNARNYGSFAYYTNENFSVRYNDFTQPIWNFLEIDYASFSMFVRIYMLKNIEQYLLKEDENNFRIKCFINDFKEKYHR